MTKKTLRTSKASRVRGKTILFTYIQPNHKDVLKYEAEKHNMSVTQLVEAILVKYIRKVSQEVARP